jgi:adenylate cyclase
MGTDEADTLAVLKGHRKELIDPKAAQYRGRTVKLMGDGALMEFASVVDAVTFAVEVQAAMATRNEGVAEDRRIVFRIGINIGDIIVDGEDIYGDGVNVAARLEGLAEPGGVCISESAHNQVRSKLDLTFEHLGEREVKNIVEPVSIYQVVLDDKAAALVTAVVQETAKRERRWPLVAVATAAVIVLAAAGAFWWQPWKPDVEPASIDKMAFPLPDKPSIAVLPFDNLSGDSKQDHLVDGLTETIITELSRFGGLFVIARNSVFTYKGKPVKVQQVAEDLGVQYVLEGSMQRSADRIRITAQLIDAVTGTHIWAQSYDRKLSDIFSVQDDVTERIVGSLGAYQGVLAEAARERAKRKDPASFSAYDAVQLGVEQKHRLTKEDNAAAQALFEKAIELDPQFAQAHVGMAWIHIQQFWFGWTDEPERAVAQTREAAQKAIALDPSDAEAHWLLAEAYLADGRFEQAEAEFERAVTLNPNHADLLAGWGYASTLLGESERASEFIIKAMRLNPHYPDWYDRTLGTSAYMSRRYEDAIAALKKVTQHVIQSRLYLAASYARLDRLAEARAEVAAAMELDADISIGKFSSIELYKNPDDLEHLRNGLRKAGLREMSPLPLPDKPSIAVLPFNNMSDDPSQDYFADGITEDLITDLSKISGLFVIARNSSFSYKGQQVKVRQVAEDLGVRYVLEGSVRRVGDQVRINAQLIDATTDGHLWADRYDGTLEDVFALQDEVSQKIVSALAVTLTPDEQKRLSHAAKANPEAYDLLLRGLERFRRYTRETNVEAREYFERAVAIDPDFARAYADIALTHAEDIFHRWTKSPERSFQLALGMAQHALMLDDDSRVGRFALAFTYLNMKRYDEALAENQRVLDLDPNHAEGHAQRGLLLSYVGRPAEGLEAIRTAMRLDPRHPFFYVWILGQAQLLLRQTEDAITQFERVIESNPDFVIGHIMLASAYAHAGRIEDAQWEAEEILVLLPDFTLTAERERAAYKDTTHLKYYLEGLRKAGLPE